MVTLETCSCFPLAKINVSAARLKVKMCSLGVLFPLPSSGRFLTGQCGSADSHKEPVGRLAVFQAMLLGQNDEAEMFSVTGF